MLIDLFVKGGPVMWPLLLCSILSLTVTVERILFWVLRSRVRAAGTAVAALARIRNGNRGDAAELLAASDDPAAKVLAAGLEELNSGGSTPAQVTLVMEQAAVRVMRSAKRGLRVLDSIVTIAPMLGLLGTVTGVIGSFSFLGTAAGSAAPLDPSRVGGGIAEALITTAFGLCIAIATVVPYNYFTGRVEREAEEIAATGSQLELIRWEGNHANTDGS